MIELSDWESYLYKKWDKYIGGLNNIKALNNWTITSDYCLFDSNKNRNNTISYAITSLPTESMGEHIRKVITKDLKEISSVSDEAIKFFKNDQNFFYISFIIDKLLESYDIEETREITEQVVQLFKEKKLTSDTLYPKINSFNERLKQKQQNYKLLSSFTIVSILTEIICNILIKKNKAQKITWVSDREKFTDIEDGIIFDILGKKINHYSKTVVSEFRFSHAFKNKSNNSFAFDDLIRLPDYISGTIASSNFDNKTCIGQKHYDLLNKALINNDRFALIKVDCSTKPLSLIPINEISTIKLTPK